MSKGEIISFYHYIKIDNFLKILMKHVLGLLIPNCFKQKANSSKGKLQKVLTPF